MELSVGRKKRMQSTSEISTPSLNKSTVKRTLISRLRKRVDTCARSMDDDSLVIMQYSMRHTMWLQTVTVPSQAAADL